MARILGKQLKEIQQREGIKKLKLDVDNDEELANQEGDIP